MSSSNDKIRSVVKTSGRHAGAIRPPFLSFYKEATH